MNAHVKWCEVRKYTSYLKRLYRHRQVHIGHIYIALSTVLDRHRYSRCLPRMCALSLCPCPLLADDGYSIE